jgi:diguanylate cyclase (GGDEF)-like protein
LIISDFSLPQFGGLRALEIALTRAPQTPFIFVSGTIGEARALEALRGGATDYIPKSDLSRLSAAIERAHNEAQTRAAKHRLEANRGEQEMRLERMTRSYRMLSSTTAAILRLRSRNELLDEVCRVVAAQGGYANVAINLMGADAQTLRCSAISGTGVTATLESALLLLETDEEYLNLARASMQTRTPIVINDIGRDNAVNALRWQGYGWQSIAAFPLLVDDSPVGTLALFSAQRGVFDDAETKILVELVANLCFALQYFEKDDAVHFLAYFDSLTGLAKRHLFCQRLTRQLEADSSAISPLTTFVLDIQKLGAINDSLGRYVGDRLIEKVAARLKTSLKTTESVAYLGGGTFAFVVTGKRGVDDTAEFMQLLSSQLFPQAFKFGDVELRPAIRVGMAFYPEDATTAEALVQNAETALQSARETNEKCVRYQRVSQLRSGNIAFEARLASALDQEAFFLHYQPKIDIASGHLIGFEALLRWRDSERGLVPPNVFVPLLERSGAIVEVGEWAMQQAVRDLQAWKAVGCPPTRIAVNVSPHQLRQQSFVDHVLSSLKPLAGCADRVDIEITESMLMQDIELSIGKLSRLREAGMKVAIDDFGTGYSSLRLLGRLPIDTLKIDRCFIEGTAEMPNVTTLVGTIISLAHALDMQTVAEGVETQEQLAMLRMMDCDQAQGFYLGRPAPSAKIPEIIRVLSPPPRRLMAPSLAITQARAR